MNTNKQANNNGWILCPSKSFPGKFYYFNVLNGEAAWSLNENEKKILKKGTPIQQVSKCHVYPEPNSPPEDQSLATSNICSIGYSLQNSSFNKPCQLPTFGQAVFPRYGPKLDQMPNMIWAPIPMLMTNMEAKKITSDQITQTSNSDKEALVHTCEIPLSERFAKIIPEIDSAQSFPVKLESAKLEKPMKNWFSPEPRSMVIPELQCKRKFDEKPKFVLKQPKLKRLRTQSETSLCSTVNLMANFPDEKNDTQTNNSETQKLTLPEPNKTKDIELGEEKNTCNRLENLNKSDLRFLLLAKRRKSFDMSSIYRNNEENSATKEIPKKKVNFNLDINKEDSFFSNTENDDTYESDKATLVSLKPLRDLAKSHIGTYWYIVVDKEVLLDDYDFIEGCILSDETCKLLTPKSTMNYIESLCTGSNVDRSRIIAARLVVGRLGSLKQHELFDDDVEGTLLDDIIRCCLRKINKNQHVVIVTKTSELIIAAKKRAIHVFNVDDIKNGTIFDLKENIDEREIKITVNNDTNEPKDNNLFLQDAKDFDPLPFSKSISNIPVACFKKALFGDSTNLFEKRDNMKENISNVNDNTAFRSDNKPNVEQSEDIPTDMIRCLVNLNIDNKKSFMKTKRVVKNPLFSRNTKGTDNVIKMNSDTQFFKYQKIIKQISNDKMITPTKQKHKNMSNNEKNINEQVTIMEKVTPTQKLTIDTQTNIKFLSSPNYWHEFQKCSTPKSKTEIEARSFNANKNKNVEGNKRNVKDSLRQNLFNLVSKNNDELKRIDKNNKMYNTLIPPEEIPPENIPKTFLDEKLKEFCQKNSFCEENIVIRLQEWLCCFIQIFEELFQVILQNDINVASQPPWTFHEGLYCLKQKYTTNKDVAIVLDKLLALCNWRQNVGVNKINISSDDFIQILGCGIILVEVIQKIEPSEEILDIENVLNNLIKNMKSSPPTDIIEQSDIPTIRCKEDSTYRQNFIKHRSEILEYLKKHYPAWRNCLQETVHEEPSKNQPSHFEENNVHDTKIFRAFGRNLNMLKINNKNLMTLDKTLKKDETDNGNKLKTNKETILNIEKQDVDENRDQNQNGIDIPIPHENTFVDDRNKDEGPKVIRNIKLIDEFEERFKNASLLDVDLLNYSEIDETTDMSKFIYEPENIENVAENVNFVQYNSETNKNGANINNCSLLNDSYSILNDFYIDGFRNDDSTKDSGFENESLQAYSMIKCFLIELSSSFKMIHTFVDRSIKEFRVAAVAEESKRSIYERSRRTRAHLAQIILHLESIVQRESTEGSVAKYMVLKGGGDAADDKRMTRYKQVVTKCLEQAQILEKCLHILSNINEDSISIISTDIHENCYFNIFE